MRMARPAEKHYLGNSVKAGSAVFKVGFWVFGGSPSKRCGIPLSFYVFVPMRVYFRRRVAWPWFCQVCVCPTQNPKFKPPSSPTRSCCSVPPPRQTLPTDTTQPTLPPIGLRQNRQTL